jgi:hypothetical protein
MAVTKTIKMNMTKEQWNAINQGLDGRRLDEFALTAMLKEVGAGAELINPPHSEPQLASLAARDAALGTDEAANELETRPAPAPHEVHERKQQHNVHKPRKDVKSAPRDGRPARMQGGRRSGSR